MASLRSPSSARHARRRSASPSRSEQRPPVRARDPLPLETGVGLSSAGRLTGQSRNSQQQSGIPAILNNNDRVTPPVSSFQASQQNWSSIYYASGLPAHLDRRLQEIRPSLRTTYGSVFQVAQDGTTYQLPATLRGVPVAKLTEDSPYWEPSWSSLERFLAQEAAEAVEKIRCRDELRGDPDNRLLKKECKTHTDNMSKHKKIREIFGHDSPYHPNQLICKRHMPPEGLCQKEMMYRLACRVADFICLHKEGLLTMDPWDFFRWRLSVKLNKLFEHPGDNAKDFARTAIYRLCDESQDGNRYDDPIMRDAVLISACFQNRFSSFNKQRTSTLIPNSSNSTYLTRGLGSLRDPRPSTLLPPHQPRRLTGTAQLGDLERQDQQARSPIWQGIGHFRAQRQARGQRGEVQGDHGSPSKTHPGARSQGEQIISQESRARERGVDTASPATAAHQARMSMEERIRREREVHDEARMQVNEARLRRQESAREGFRLAQEDQDREARRARQGRLASESPGDTSRLGGSNSSNVFLQIVGSYFLERQQNDAARERADRERQARASDNARQRQDKIQRVRRERRGYY